MVTKLAAALHVYARHSSPPGILKMPGRTCHDQPIHTCPVGRLYHISTDCEGI